MKRLKNKETGEIKKFKCLQADYVAPLILTVENSEGKIEMSAYSSLAEFNEKWEDYAGPEEYWFIDYDGGILCREYDNSSAEKMMISMGNHFNSLEEAEKTVEKLKAWKRLKEKIIDHVLKYEFDESTEDIYANISFSVESYPNVGNDLDLLFGGKE